jgi:hypothetical protein
MAENSEVDLFGLPVVRRGEGRGRPSHQWTLENSNRVLLAFARGLSLEQAAVVIGVSLPTLRKHYFSEVKQQAEAKLRMEMTQLVRLNKTAAEGNVAAEKELGRRLEKAAIADTADRVANRGRNGAPAQPRLGKKEEAQEAAQAVTGRFAPRSAPPGLLN